MPTCGNGQGINANVDTAMVVGNKIICPFPEHLMSSAYIIKLWKDDLTSYRVKAEISHSLDDILFKLQFL